MAYTPVTFVDGVTPLNAANLNKLEDGVEALDTGKQDKSEKAQANGYPSLDGTGKVPLAQLPTISAGADLSYDGDWVAGTYQDGDIVVKDGIAYLCVGGPTAVAPDPAPWGLASTAAGYGTSLPASPVDGQEHVLVDSVSNPTYQWRFRYNAGSSSAYKWEYIGGTPRAAEVNTQVLVSSSTFVDPSDTAGPSFTIPRSGEYLADYGSLHVVAGGNDSGFVTIKLGAAAAADTEAVSGAANNSNDAAWATIKRTAVAGDVWKLMYRCTGSVYFARRRLFVVPVRVA
jgi:hypothetical protein